MMCNSKPLITASQYYAAPAEHIQLNRSVPPLYDWSTFYSQDWMQWILESA